MNKRTHEIAVGLFIILGLGCLGYLSINLGGVGIFNQNRYELVARFTSASGLNEGAFVETAGVRVGLVKKIEFEPESFLAKVTISIDDVVEISEDSIASIRTSGIIGDKFVKITSGGSDEILQPGMEIFETEPSISLEELISKYIFESGDK